MNYFLDDVRTFLINNSVTNVTINKYQSNLPDQVCLLSTGGSIRADQRHSNVSWQILVTSTSKSNNSAQLKSRQIFNLLQNKHGMLGTGPNAVIFLKILAQSEPSFLGLTSNGLSEFTTLYSANIREQNLLNN